jgi:hypothetical protein
VVREKRLAPVLCLIAAVVLCCEWLADETHRCPEFSYRQFQNMLRADTIDQNLVTVVLPPYTNSFGRNYVRLWIKGDPLCHFMFIPTDFLNHDGPALKKTRAYRIQSCGNCEIIGIGLKIFFEMVIAGCILLAFRSKLSNET